MPELPAGTVTFLFTDIEDSTKQWEQFPEAMRQALARHDALLHQAIADHSGHVIKTLGDGFHAVFANASDAVSAVLAAQLALQTECWPEPVRILARMGLHSGEAQLRDGDYYGTVVNRAARLMAVGHGGQALLSGVTHSLLATTLLSDVSLKDLGAHRLKDLQQPEQVWQVMHPGLPSDFAPLKSLDPIRTNLPIQLTSFIGRDKELQELKHLLATTRLLTLTGSGGTGKTRLALEVGADRLDDYPDGVWLVELDALPDASLVPQTVATALGIREEPKRAILDTLKDHLKCKQLLLLLDNCEHLIEACAQLCETLLRSCPYLKILATSREGLRLGAEQTYQVPSLHVPGLSALPQEQTDLSRMLLAYDSVRLFVERARQQRSDFTLSGQNASAVAGVCQRLSGIPLAIELAAARIRSLSVEQINNRLDQRFRLLTGGNRAALPRHQTLRALIDWSYDLLTPSEQTLLGRLSVFAGGWTLEAAEAICGDASNLTTENTEGHRGTASPQRPTPNAQRLLDVLDLLTSLVDKSLVIYEEDKGGAGRYRLLETVREYAQEKLGESEETEVVREEHRKWYLSFAEAADPKLRGAELGEWLSRLDAEHDNLRGALSWSLRSKGAGVTAALRLCGLLSRFWWTRGYLEEGRRWCVTVLACPAKADGAVERARTLNGAGVLASFQGNYAAARAYHEESLVIFRAVGDRRGIASALNNLGNVAHREGDYASARTCLEQCLAIMREIGDRWGIASSLNNLGNAALNQGDYASARTYHEESLAVKREIGDRWGIATSLTNLGGIAWSRGDYDSARTYHEESLAIMYDIGDRQRIAGALIGLGGVACRQGDYVSAHDFYEKSLAIYRETGDRQGIALSLNELGDVAESQVDYALARAYFDASLVIRQEIGDRRGIAYSLCGLGNVAYEQGDYASARAYYDESLVIRREIGDRRGVASSLNNLGNVADRQSDYASARDCHEESLTIKLNIGDRWGIAESLEGLAGLAAAESAWERGARLWGAAEVLREQIGSPLSLNEREAYERATSAAREAMGTDAFGTAWTLGRAMTLEEAVAYALQQSEP